MSDETTALGADTNDPAPEAQAEAGERTGDEAGNDEPAPAAVDDTAVADLEAKVADLTERLDAVEAPVEVEATGGELDTTPRKTQATEVDLIPVLAGDERITTELLDAIELRHDIGDHRTLVAACRNLLAELEG